MLDTPLTDPAPDAPAQESLLELLARIEKSPSMDRQTVIAAYTAWIDRNSPASELLHAALFNLGVELGQSGDDDGAIAAYQQALALRPDFHPAALNLGMRLEAAGRIEQALTVWGDAVQPEALRATLAAERARLLGRIAERDQPATVLHVGCGPMRQESLPSLFRAQHWKEIRLDIDPAVAPDILASMTDMSQIGTGTMDAVYAAHCLAQLAAHDVTPALREMRRVLKPHASALITTPDLQEVASHIAQGRLDEALYLSPMGPIAPHDILFGHRDSVAAGKIAMAHRTGFIATTLAASLIGAGFAACLVQRDPARFNLIAIGFPERPDDARLVAARAQMMQPDAPAPVFYSPAA